MFLERSLEERALAHAALGDPVRLAVVDRLQLGDASPSEIGRDLGMPSNLLAHHLRQLEEASLVERVRSQGDRRRTYLRLRPTMAGLVATDGRPATRVVFVCTHNTARSRLAAALWKRRSRVPAASAGTEPAERVHPLAVATARAHGLTLGRTRPTHLDHVLRPDDLLVAVCDTAHEHLDPATQRLHWSVPDPARIGTEAAFADAFQELADRVDRLAPIVHPPRS